MANRYREFHDKSIVHSEGAVAGGEFTLCGLAYEGVDGDAPMEPTRDLIRCDRCEAIISFCKVVKPSEINKFSRRMLEVRRSMSR